MSRPPNRRGPGRVTVQIARPGGAGADDAPSRGRHRSPDADAGAPVLAASSLVGAPRHRRARSAEPAEPVEPAGPAGLPARSLARVEEAREAATRSAVDVSSSTTGTAGATADATAPLRSPRGEPAAARPDEEAVTDLVARPGRGALPDGPGSGPGPAVLGCAVSVVALVAAVVVAAVAVPGASRTTLLGVLAVAVLGTGTAALGLGRQRARRTLAVTGVVIGSAAVVASVIALLPH